ncbi:MAG: carbon dioxide concentrating mechanism protein [Microcoleaceae cyanobacterium]
MQSESPLSQNLTDFAMSGDVILAPSAAIANGVLLHANPDSQIVVGAGVCIGVGTILHAYQGILEIQIGATIGARVLMLGSGKVGVNACIGSGSTLIDPAIKAEQVVASGSLMGDNSRKLEENENGSSETSAQPDPVKTPEPESEPESSTVSSPSEPKIAKEKPKFPQPKVYGQANLDQLLDSLLPHRKAYNKLRPKSGEISTMGDEQTSG